MVKEYDDNGQRRNDIRFTVEFISAKYQLKGKELIRNLPRKRARKVFWVIISFIASIIVCCELWLLLSQYEELREREKEKRKKR